jgi:hypothetical protein
MGTNYYVKAEEKPACPTCGHHPNVEPLHIGKSSGGWQFLFAPYPEHGLTSWAAWKSFLADKGIVDEYGQDVPLAELEDWVLKKQRDGVNAKTATHDQWGPYGRDSEKYDDEGFRFSSTADFS